MLNLNNLKEFEWDKGNIDKSYEKHSITPNQAEEAFLDTNVAIEDDIKHVQNEPRFIALGKTKSEIVLFIVFTIRKTRIRIISARYANRKERRRYEKAKENTRL